jgi:hypothetical protein
VEVLWRGGGVPLLAMLLLSSSSPFSSFGVVMAERGIAWGGLGFAATASYMRPGDLGVRAETRGGIAAVQHG